MFSACDQAQNWQLASGACRDDILSKTTRLRAVDQALEPCSRPKFSEVTYLQPCNNRPYRRRRRRSRILSSPRSSYRTILFAIFTFFISCTQAVFIPFEDCLPAGVINSNPRQLQWIPLWLDASFSYSSAHRLSITTYGNVTGQLREGPYPPPDSPSWKDSNSTFGKITNYTANAGLGGKDVYTTLFTRYNVLTFTPYDNRSPFCESVTANTSCPIGPAFYKDADDPYQLPAFSVDEDFNSSYSLATFQTTIIVQSGEENAPNIACVSAIITPDLGNTLSSVLTSIPAVILAIVAISTVAASVFSPWGSTDLFKWTSNYGRDEDLLRLVTPGFGDCLQYIQFIVLAGSLSLSYPGYFQPVVSKVSWSALMFNESFVSHGNGTQNPVDGIYVTNGTYGLDRMSQLVGMTAVEDIWAGMVIWALVIVAVVIVLCQIGFVFRFASRYINKTTEEDLRRKNWPFTAGNVVRIVCNYFLLPIVSLSMFQMLVTTSGPAILSAFAAVLLVAIFCFAAWILRLIFSTKPRSLLFDDLPTVLLYGPLYNTYSDDAAPFALIPALLTIIRGIAIGAVQSSGIAQLVILAICEVNLILTLYAFRPFHSPTSMNAYHTFFSGIRLITVLLQVAFVPSLGVTEAPKGWIGYVILLLHAIVLIFGFFLNAIQTLIEVIARRAGAGGEAGQSATRGGLNKVFGMRQLSKRAKRPGLRASQQSGTAMLTHDDEFKSFQNGDRSRSLSASSAILLNQRPASDGRLSTHLDRFSSADDFDSPREHGTFSFLPSETRYAVAPGGAPLGLKNAETTDPYYRPPRPRRATGELTVPATRSRGSLASAELMNRNYEEREADLAGGKDPATALRSFQGTPVPAYIRGQANDSDPNTNDPRRSHVDYAVREVDFYYGVRGPALNNQPTRKLKTGPADPVGPVSSATGWFRSMLGWKTKDKGKGFEVVRSSRAPHGFDEDDEEVARPPPLPYSDGPEAQTEVVLPGQRTRSTDLDRGYSYQDDANGPSPLNSDDERELESKYRRKRRNLPVSDGPPTLDTEIDSGGAIELPSRFGSKGSSSGPRRNESTGSAPTVPRKSSKRDDRADFADENRRLSTVLDLDSPPLSPERRRSSTGIALDVLSDRPATSNSIGDRLATGQRTASGGTTMVNVPYTTGGPEVRASMQSGVSSLDEIPPSQPSHGPGVSAMTDQPTTYGYVSQHGTNDSLQQPSQNASSLERSTAEIVNDLSQRDSELGTPKNWPLQWETL